MSDTIENTVFNFGKRLKELRESKKLRQEDVAQKLGISKAAVSCYETDQTLPRLEIVKALCSIYGVSSDYLLDINIGVNDCILLNDGLTDQQKELLKNMVSGLTEEFLYLNQKVEKY